MANMVNTKLLSRPRAFFKMPTSVLALFATAASLLPTPGQALSKIPEGVFSIANDGLLPQDEVLANPDVTGVTLRQGWKDLEPTEGVYNWSYLDEAVAAVGASGKKVLLRISTMAGRPTWVTTAVQRAHGKFFTFTNSGIRTTIPVFWDPTFVAKKKAMITALGAHLTNNPTVVIVVASFANAVSEDWNVPHTSVDVTNWRAVGYTSQKMLDTGKTIIDATMAAFPNQFVTLAIGGNGHLGFGKDLDPSATYVAENALDTARASWPGRMIAQVNTFSTFGADAPGPDDSVWNLLWNNQPNVGGQMLFQCENDPTFKINNGIPIDPGVALTLSINKGLEYGINYLEIYQIDVVNLPLVISYAHDVIGQ